MKRLTLIVLLFVAISPLVAAGCATGPSPVVKSTVTVPVEPAPTEQQPGSNSAEVAATADFKMADVEKHSAPEDCWIVVDGSVYDMSSFGGRHPGGEKPIAMNCGKDGTAIFKMRPNGTPHPDKAFEALQAFRIGRIAE